ncbi:MAG TPA: diaminopimelate epimerase [Rhizomicrobium sp.]|jgi:diaminopimelate epimerase|nr:diaminopimelate epimerase [Rhizomicrobium sp.]
MTPFLKMHGLGNDFVVFDARKQGLALDSATARGVADRHLGIGCDQVIVIHPGRDGADAIMQVRNCDGSEVEQCGNATRCVARLLMEETGRDAVRIDTLGGPLLCSDAGGGAITVDWGKPRLMWDEVPMASATDTNLFELNVDGAKHEASAVSVGNPHVVLFVEDAEAAPVAALGPRIETHPLFPERTNVEFVSVHGDDKLRMRVWERGAGITLACGSGACAVAAAAFRRGLTGRKMEIVLDGGSLHLEVRESDDHILMTGPATLSFKGEADLKALAQ